MSSRKLGLALGLVFAACSAALVVGCTSILGSFDVDPSLGTEAGAEGGGGAGLGVACTNASECPSGFCVDGVCCESACSGVCEACNLAEKGKCLPHPANTDPDKECKAVPRPDAGPPPAEVDAGDGGVPEGGDGGGGVINLPENFVQDDPACAPACNGQRACGFPGKDKDCGTKFCNSKEVAGRFACNGAGLCDLDIAACDAYSCKGDACGTTCAATDDCLETHFCNAQGKCQPKLGNGIECTLPTQCGSGFCVEGVCCNSGCSDLGGTCKSPGKVGQCICPTCPNGTCRLFYRDSDGDGFGDKDGNLGTNTAVIGCVGQPPPVGYKDRADDCDDGDANVFPGQTQWFATASAGKGTFDYNCSGKVDKELPEFPGGSCTFCGPPKTCATATTCTTANTQAVLSCQLGSYLCGINPIKFCDGCGRNGFTSNTEGFRAAIQCGQSSTYYTCGSCTLAGGTVKGGSTASRQQRCH